MKAVPIFYCVYALLSSLITAGQEKISHTVSTTENSFATIDRAGDLYLVKTSGDIEKYNQEGQLLNTFKNTTSPTLFDTGNGVRLLAYDRKNQEYSILNPSLNKVESAKLDSSFAISPWLVCSSGDYNLWILDKADWSLKKVDPKEEMVLVDVLIDTVHRTAPAFVFMREYQHFLFLLDANDGILIFNSVGKFIRSIPAKNLTYFNFLGEDLYFMEGDKLIFIDLFTLEKTQKLLTNPAPCVLVTDEKMYQIHFTRVEISEFKP
jgi:hypothetical protein